MFVEGVIPFVHEAKTGKIWAYHGLCILSGEIIFMTCNVLTVVIEIGCIGSDLSILLMFFVLFSKCKITCVTFFRKK